MDTKLIHHFLNDITKHNNREWFHANKSRYLEAKETRHPLLARQVAL